MGPKDKEEEDDLIIEVGELDDKEARQLELSVSITGATDLSEVADAASKHGDVIDEMFDGLMMPSEPPPPPPATIPPPNPKLAAKVFKPPAKEKARVIEISGDEEDIFFLEDEDAVAEDDDLDPDEEAFYKQFED